MIIVGRVLLIMGRCCLSYAVPAAEAEKRSGTETALLETSFEALGSGLRDWVMLFVLFDMAIRATKASWRLRLGPLVL
jgi:hypothetical protein